MIKGYRHAKTVSAQIADFDYNGKGLGCVMPKYHFNKSFISEPIRFLDIYLVQIGRLYFGPSGEMHMHAHKNFYELTIITDGEGEVVTNGIPTAVKRGDIYLSMPSDIHGIRSSAEAPMKYDFFSFITENAELGAALEEIASFATATERVFRDERISALVGDAIMEFVESGKFGSEILYSIFKQIIIYVIRGMERGTHQRMRNASAADEICYQIMNYIDTHINTMTDLSELADAMNYNYSYLSALFKRRTGNTLFSYYQKKKLDAARLLISEGSLKITEIADVLGYSSLYSFSRAFREHFGISPKQYAKK